MTAAVEAEVVPFCTECGGRVYQRATTGLWWHYHGPDFFGPCDWGRPYPKTSQIRKRGGRRAQHR